MEMLVVKSSGRAQAGEVACVHRDFNVGDPNSFRFAGIPTMNVFHHSGYHVALGSRSILCGTNDADPHFASTLLTFDAVVDAIGQIEAKRTGKTAAQ